MSGKTVVVTRAVEQSRELFEVLESFGARVLQFPTICFAPPEDFAKLDAALRGLAHFDWVLFTSQNAVRFSFQRKQQLGMIGSAQAPRPRVAAIGSATAQAARNLDIRVDFVATEETGEGFAAELKHALSGARVLLPRSDRADDRLPAALRSAGANVEEVVAYRTAAPESFDPAVVDEINAGLASAIIFASPSAFDNFLGVIGVEKVKSVIGTTQLAAIGPTTAGAIRRAGFDVAVESEESSAAGMASAIARYYEKLPAAARHS